jgi:hypothetical protein
MPDSDPMVRVVCGIGTVHDRANCVDSFEVQSAQELLDLMQQQQLPAYWSITHQGTRNQPRNKGIKLSQMFTYIFLSRDY